MNRVRSVKRQRCDDVSTHHRFEWAVPIIQPFQPQIELSSTILCTHYDDIGISGSLAHYAAKLRRKRVTPGRFDFHAVNELLHMFDAMVIRVWEFVQECKYLDEGSMLFPADVLQELSEQGVDKIVDRILDMTSRPRLNGTVSDNAALFIRDMLIYIEFSSAIKTGDVGHIREVLVWITAICHAGGAKNCAYELLHPHCGLKYSWAE
ncbi:hypothetical protein BX616_003812 [Lobosporangium transversale]|nr:hypothetical protein BX616_003812 [Lobosporangium transversale]